VPRRESAVADDSPLTWIYGDTSRSSGVELSLIVGPARLVGVASRLLVLGSRVRDARLAIKAAERESIGRGEGRRQGSRSEKRGILGTTLRVCILANGALGSYVILALFLRDASRRGRRTAGGRGRIVPPMSYDLSIVYRACSLTNVFHEL